MQRILVIEDDPSGMGLLITLLQLAGYEGCPLLDWEDPVGYIAGERPELVIMDVRLGVHHGLDLLCQLRAHPDASVASIPVLMLSAEDRADECLAAGASGFIEKPFDPDELYRTIQETMEVSL